MQDPVTVARGDLSTVCDAAVVYATHLRARAAREQREHGSGEAARIDTAVARLLYDAQASAAVAPARFDGGPFTKQEAKEACLIVQRFYEAAPEELRHLYSAEVDRVLRFLTSAEQAAPDAPATPSRSEAELVRKRLRDDPFVSNADYGRLVEEAAQADEARELDSERGE